MHNSADRMLHACNEARYKVTASTSDAASSAYVACNPEYISRIVINIIRSIGCVPYIACLGQKSREGGEARDFFSGDVGE